MAQDLNPKPNDTPQPLAVNDPSLTISLAKPTPKRTTTSEQQSTVNQQQDSKGTSKVKVGDHSATITFGSVATTTTPHAATQFGDYEIVGEIARGGMGVVYKARQPRLNRTVAVKMILAGNFASESAVKRFYTEAEAAAQLDHSGIVPIYEVGERNGQHFFSMAFIDGESLQTQIKKGPLPAQQAAQLLHNVAEAVQYAHSKGIVHRDLKPHNILLDQDGKPKLTDFGLAKRMDSEEGLTASGDVLGTPGYMAPEQAAGQVHEQGPPVDVYALGAILYATLTGRPPFQAASLSETLRQVIEQEPVSPKLLNASTPRDLETICLKCLQKEPAKRYRSAGALAEELGRFQRGEPILARPVGYAERVFKWVRRRPAIAALLGLLALITTSAFVAISHQLGQTRAALSTASENAEAYKKASDLATKNQTIAEKAAKDAQLALERFRPRSSAICVV